MDKLATYLEDIAEDNSPLIIAGDFNDWRNEADTLLARRLRLVEIFGSAVAGMPVRSFPAKRPVLRLDRIYVRGFLVKQARVHSGKLWSKLSNHAALSAQLIPYPEKSVYSR